MPPKPSAGTRKAEGKIEALSLLCKISEQIPAMLELKDQEIRIDHGNDLQTQQALELARQIKFLSKEENVRTLAHVLETLLIKQVEADLNDDEPWKKERDLLIKLSNLTAQATAEVRKL